MVEVEAQDLVKVDHTADMGREDILSKASNRLVRAGMECTMMFLNRI